ncbi:hypothetical protein ACP70R_023637 [Stipagrostis hirtigluma subsp. patula]
MADKLEKAALPLPLSVAKTQKKAPGTLLPTVVQLVSVWALITACAFGATAAYNLYLNSHPHSPAACPPEICYMVTGEKAVAEAHDHTIWMMWCSVLEAAAAAMALLLSARRRRSRRALALLALAAAAANHYVHARDLRLVSSVASSGRIMFKVENTLVFVFAFVDLLGFMALLLE